MSVLLEARPYRPFKSSEEYLVAMKEDLAEWLNALYPELRINLDNFMDRLDTGVALCKHANNVRKSAAEYVARRQARKVSMTRSITSTLALPMSQVSDVAFLPNAKPGTFFARDNVSNFIAWCRNSLGIIECLLFETDDLIMRKNERHVILCLLEVARRGAKFGMLAPMLVQMERQIDREIAAENKTSVATTTEENEESDEDEYADMQREEPCLIYGPQPQIVTNDLKSLDEMVRDLVERCTCPTQFPMIRVSEGKYRIGDTKVLIFVRILRSHVMVRVGGGWDTLSHYLDKHDPCRCRTSHRSMISAKLIQKAGGSFDLGSAQVHYERSPPRTRRSSASSVGSLTGAMQNQQSLLAHGRSVSSNRSRSPTPHRAGNVARATGNGEDHQKKINRSRSPTPQRKLLNSHHNIVLAGKQRSRSPTPSPSKTVQRSRSPTPKVDRARCASANSRTPSEENRSPTHQPHDERDMRKEAKCKIGEEFSKRYVVEGGVARRSGEDNTPKYEPTIYGYKCREDASSRSPTASSSSPSPPAIIKEEPILESYGKEVTSNPATTAKSSPHGELSEHSDNCSEVSDEGYRSLGAVQPPTSIGSSNNVKQQPTPAVAECQKQPAKIEERSCVETDSIETGLRKTKASPVSPLRSSPSRSVASSTTSGDRTPRAGSMAREISNVSRTSSCSGGRTPQREYNSSPEGSPLKRNTIRGSIRKPPTGSLSKASGVHGKPTWHSSTSSNIGSNTWNGRQSKQRPSLNTETFSPLQSTSTGNGTCTTTPSFSRKSPGRQSLPRPAIGNGPQYDRNGRRIKPSVSLQSSPTKVANPLLEQILQKVGHLQDDRLVMQKLQDLIKDYRSNGSTRTDGESNMDFTRAWIDGNGTVMLPNGESQVAASPRKDPKQVSERSGFSRIPAPVYKRAMSVASDSI